MNQRRFTSAAFALYLIGATVATINVVTRGPLLLWLLQLNTFLFFIFAVTHARAQMGARRMLIFLALTFAISFLFETLGVLTGVIYGPYFYTDRLGAKLGVVPVLIPLAWFMMMYASNTVVEIIAGSATVRAVRDRWGLARALAWSAWLALLSAMAMTAWDLGMDPQNVAAGHWVWTAGGAYFGIPVRNFIGWLATTFTVFLLLRVYELTQPARVIQFNDRFALLPLVVYAFQGLVTIIVGIAADQRAPALITFFAMGAFVFVAVTRLISFKFQVSKFQVKP